MSLYWTESYNDEAGYRYMVRKLSPSGYVNTIIANEQFEYFGIVVDDAGVIYVTSDYKILKID